ncbi:hypothetical protein Y1Q_0018981 [Alligator mississippiensis]|uniref:Uncharacterized protein n=1 Tax=Alligator mississippiensis TaxID=8496 RepID=A0A151M3H0_ALLMI|nr:hypothetical protein Y1Q_0018981 [Alligator mississippiensis]
MSEDILPFSETTTHFPLLCGIGWPVPVRCSTSVFTDVLISQLVVPSSSEFKTRIHTKNNLDKLQGFLPFSLLADRRLKLRETNRLFKDPKGQLQHHEDKAKTILPKDGPPTCL